MRKSKKKQQQNLEKINKAKEQLTVNVIQYNHIIEKLKKSILQSVSNCELISKKHFNNQRELIARKRMTQRVLNSTLKMLDNNKLYLWMIDEEIIKQENK